jgi:RHS repeat-associated protein
MQALWREPKKCIERFLRAVRTLIFAGIEPNPETAAQRGRVGAQMSAVRRIGSGLAFLLCLATPIIPRAQASAKYIVFVYSTSLSWEGDFVNHYYSGQTIVDGGSTSDVEGHSTGYRCPAGDGGLWETFTTTIESIYIADSYPQNGSPQPIYCDSQKIDYYLPTTNEASFYFGTAAPGTVLYAGVNHPPPPTSPPNNLGGPAAPSPPGNPNAGCASGGGSDPTRDTSCGDPINAATGNKFQVERDFIAAPITGLELTRYYNSQVTTNSGFGPGWRGTWQRALSPSASSVVLTRADGHADTFRLVAGVWEPSPNVTSRLTEVLGSSKHQIGWQVFNANDTTETYTLDGKLSAITTRAGLTTRLVYDANGRVTTVTGPFGDALRFAHDSTGRFTRMTVADGGIYTYAYDAAGNLVSVTRPDGAARKYIYDDAKFRHALTGIIDENGSRYATWTYDAKGRAISSQHVGGVDLTTVAYNANGTTSATDADGNTHTYLLQTQFGVIEPTALTGAPYPAAGGESFSYDSNGFVKSRSDFDGNLTLYVHNSLGEQTSRTEGFQTYLARTITTTWLSNYHLPTSITEPGRVTYFAYDAKGNLLKKTITAGSLSRSWAYTYNSAGQVLTATDPLGNVTSYTYDSTGDVATVMDPLGHVTSYTSYDADGRPLGMTDPNGLATKWTYNFRGEITSKNVGGEVTTYAYDPVGQLVKATHPDGSYFTYTYDAAHRPTAIGDAVGDKMVYAYDPASNVTKIQVYDPNGHLSRAGSFAYDMANRLAQAIGAQGQITAFAYDPQGNLTTFTDPLGHATSHSYDPLNRLVTSIDPNHHTTTYIYDLLDHLIGVTDPRNLQTSYTWDGLDDRTAVSSPDSGGAARTFDAAGNVIASTDARGLTTTYKYDALNRPIQATYADGKVVSWQYDQGANGIGHLTKMTDRSGNTRWTCDRFGHVLTKIQTTAGKTFTTAMSYDAAGRLAAIVYPSGAAIELAYDKAGRVSGLRTGGKALISGVTYQPFGPVSAWAQGNGGAYSRTFDQDGRITGIGLGNGAMALAYDAASRITGITETGLPAKSFAYDALSRLTGYTSGSTALTYGYDANGNRTSLAAGSTTTYNVSATSNRLLGSSGAGTRSIGYDADGNVVSDSQSLTVFGYTYDASARLVQAKTGALATAYANNGLGERVTRSGYGASSYPGGKQEFVYDPAGHLLGEYDGNGKAIEETVWLGDPRSGPGRALPVAVLISGQAPYYVAPDQLGGPHRIADAARNTVWHWDHDPFGNGAPTSSITYNLRFPGQYFDRETGLHYNGFRDYDPTVGRYVQSDPIRLRGGTNPYVYVLGNPVLGFDPAGLWTWSDISTFFQNFFSPTNIINMLTTFLTNLKRVPPVLGDAVGFCVGVLTGAVDNGPDNVANGLIYFLRGGPPNGADQICQMFPDLCSPNKPLPSPAVPTKP